MHRNFKILTKIS